MVSSLGDIGVEQSEAVDPLHVELSVGTLLAEFGATMQAGRTKSAILRSIDRLRPDGEAARITEALQQYCDVECSDEIEDYSSAMQGAGRVAVEAEMSENQYGLDEDLGALRHLNKFRGEAEGSLLLSDEDRADDEKVTKRYAEIAGQRIRGFVIEAYRQSLRDEQCGQAIIDGFEAWSRHGRLEASA